MKKPVRPGDLLWLDTRHMVELIGIVLEHHDDLIVAMPVDYQSFERVKGPGVSIYWHTSNMVAYWDYKRVSDSLRDETMKILARSE